MRLIDAEAVEKSIREFRCDHCDRRMGYKKGKRVFLYEIGGVPCRACDIDDAFFYLEDAPIIDAIPVEWLKEKRNDELHKLAENVYGRLEDELCIAIIRVLELWNKEKEGDNG